VSTVQLVRFLLVASTLPVLTLGLVGCSGSGDRNDPNAWYNRTVMENITGRSDYAPALPLEGAPAAVPVGTVAVNTQPGYAVPPTQSTYSIPPGQPGYSGPPAQPASPVFPAQPAYFPAQPAYAAPPAQPTYAVPAAQPAYTVAAAQPTYTAPPAQPTYVGPPAQPAYVGRPAQPAYTGPPAQPASVTLPPQPPPAATMSAAPVGATPYGAVPPNELYRSEASCGTMVPPPGGHASADVSDIGLQMTECEVARHYGPPDKVELGALPNGARLLTLSYLRGPRPRIYHFAYGRLVSIENLAAPPPHNKHAELQIH